MAESILRVVVVASWAVYVTLLISAIPVSPEVIVAYLMGVASAAVGMIATVAALINFCRWPVLSHIAAWVFLVGYLARLIYWSSTTARASEASVLGGLATVAKDAWRMAQHFYDTSGAIGTLPLVFSLVAMPLVQVAIIWAVFASPNQSLSRTRGTAPRAG